jgi:MFS family permease
VQLAVVGAGTLVVPLDTTVNVAFPHIVAAFGIAVPAVKWVVICYVLTHAGLMLAAGRLGDLFGYRRVFLIGCLWSAAAFSLCAAAPSYGFLLAARGLQGVGAALVLSVGPALATAAYPAERRVRVLGLYTMMFAVGAAAGPVLGGGLLAEWGWRAVYGFRVPLALLAFGLAWALPAGTARGGARFDVAGGALMLLAMGAGLLALDMLPRDGAAAGGLAVVAALAGWGFMRVERRVASPLVALGLFGDARLAMALVAGVGVNLAGFAILLLGPFLLRQVAELSPVGNGLVLMASPLGMVVAAPLAERVAARVGIGRLTALGLVVVAAGLGMLGVGSAAVGVMAAGMFVQGFGQGLFQVANFDLITGALPERDRGVAGGLAMLTRSVGLMLGATLLMLAMQALSGAGPGGMVAGIERTYWLAALVPLVLLAVVRTSAAAGR